MFNGIKRESFLARWAFASLTNFLQISPDSKSKFAWFEDDEFGEDLCIGKSSCGEGFKLVEYRDHGDAWLLMNGDGCPDGSEIYQ
jgi:hypothetical protein